MYRVVVVFLFVVTFVGCAQKSEIENSLAAPQVSSGQTPIAQSSQATVDQSSQAQVPQGQASEEYFASQAAMPAAEESFSGPSIEEIQQALKNAGLYEGKIDGDLGPKTKKAIADFQSQNDLKADGKVGPKTWGRLKPHLNPVTENASVGQ